jgi:hypothetical protein
VSLGKKQGCGISSNEESKGNFWQLLAVATDQ